MLITPTRSIEATLPAGADKADARPVTDKPVATDALLPTDNNEAAVTRGHLQQVTDTMNNIMESLDRDIRFSIHEKTKRMIVQVVDTKDNRVIKEFPPHQLLDTLGAIREYVGILLDEKG